jgi:hypothetical protein
MKRAKAEGGGAPGEGEGDCGGGYNERRWMTKEVSREANDWRVYWSPGMNEGMGNTQEKL